MDEKYILTRDYVCDSGTIPSGSDIIVFRGQVYVNGGPIPSVYNDIFLKLIKDPTYVKKVRIHKNEF